MDRRPAPLLKNPVSAVGFGCMSFAGFLGPTTEAESMQAMAHALELGVDFWDTANVYGDGLSETLIGAFLRQEASRRRRITLATKFAIRRGPDGVRGFDNSADYMAECLDASLMRLGVDHVDLYYVHRVDPNIPVEDTVGALTKHIQSGKIGAIGFSEIAPDTLRRAASVHPIAAVQSEYSLWTRGPELGMLQATAELGALLVAFSPLARGFLSGSLQTRETFEKADFRSQIPRFAGPAWRRNRDHLKKFLDLAEAYSVTPTALAIAWTLAKYPHIIPIPGTRTAEHLAECVAGGRLHLTAAQVAEVERALPAGFAAGERYSPGQWVGVEKY